MRQYCCDTVAIGWAGGELAESRGRSRATLRPGLHGSTGRAKGCGRFPVGLIYSRPAPGLIEAPRIGDGTWKGVPMRTIRETITVQSVQPQEFIDVTKQVRDVVARSAVRQGMLVVNALHTTVALFVNEFQGALLHDLGELLQKLIPRRDGYRHDDPRHSDCDRGNGHAHLRSMLLGRSIAIPVDDGEPVLGQYQGLILAELDGPRERKIAVQVMGA
jgi:secondary thiamine-phosphate synthase enzyme